MIIKYSRKRDGNVQLSKNFKVSELDCKCKDSTCDEVLIDTRLVDILQQIRDHFGVSVHVNSGYRCESHNAAVGGSKTSHHMRGMAADIRVKGVAPAEVAKYAESIGVKRIGLYEGDAEGNFVHIGSDERKRFWLGHAGTNVDTFGSAPTPAGTEPTKYLDFRLPVLKRGMKGGSVWAMQALLIGYGYDLGGKGLDGSFGAATEAALLKYQLEHDLEVDGSCGRQTWNSLLGLEG